MEPFEQKLKEYFDRIQPDEAFLDQLKSLETSPGARQARRSPRRWLTPIAAAVTAVLALGSCWTYLRSTLPGSAPEPTPGVISYAEAEPGPTAALLPDPASPSVESAEGPEPQAPVRPNQPAAKAPSASETPTQEIPPQSAQPEEPSPGDSAPKDNPPTGLPEISAQPHDPGPETASLDKDEPLPPEQSESDPPKKPEENPEPSVEVPNVSEGIPIIFAQYQATDSRETLTLSNLITHESAEIDVTGLLPPPEPSPAGQTGEHDPSAEASASAETFYTGYCSAFGWSVRYTLMHTVEGEIYAVAMAEHPE